MPKKNLYRDILELVPKSERNNPILLVTILAAVFLIYAIFQNPPKGDVKSAIDTTKLYTVEKVIDGDTMKIKDVGTIRLIGMDTPEVVDPRKPVECFGREASDRAKQILLNQKVMLELDSSQDETDRYGRILAYIYTEDGTFYNLEMIKEGYAHEYTYSVPYKYQDQFKMAQKEAEQKQRGLWGDACSL